MSDVIDIDPGAHGFKVDVSGKVASSEAELANKRIDAKIPEFDEEIDHEAVDKMAASMRESVGECVKALLSSR